MSCMSRGEGKRCSNRLLRKINRFIAIFCLNNWGPADYIVEGLMRGVSGTKTIFQTGMLTAVVGVSDSMNLMAIAQFTDVSSANGTGVAMDKQRAKTSADQSLQSRFDALRAKPWQKAL